ncbi:hypothetical protein ACIBCN_35090 [Nocardia sp. NPDC051052]|uniref:hypothetical protein n=1 Tax=Nocardia sp. NPDC051052 TaxID=3364322 RepID=UPI0037A39030
MSENEPASRNNNRGGTAPTPFWKSALFWTVVGSVGTVVTIFIGVAQCAGSNSSTPTPNSPPIPTPSALPTTTAPPPLAQGHQQIANVEGIDLDTGQVHDQNQLGVDISPSKTGDSLNAMTNGNARFAIPRDDAAAAAGPDRCTTILPAAWTKTLANTYHLPTGSHLCVQTDQGNLADLTLTHIPSAAEQYLEFDFTTWRPR